MRGGGYWQWDLEEGLLGTGVIGYGGEVGYWLWGEGVIGYGRGLLAKPITPSSLQ